MTQEPSPPTETPAAHPSDRVECPASRDPALRRFIVAAILLALGLWCIYDVVTGKYQYVDPGVDINAFLKWAFNTFAPIILIPLGLYLVISTWLMLRRVLVADNEGLGYVGKPKIRWDDVERVDASRLQSKGYLYIHHGTDEELTLDSWKLKNFRALVTLIEDKVPDEKLDYGEEA